MVQVEDGGNVIGNFPDGVGPVNHGFLEELVVKIVYLT